MRLILYLDLIAISDDEWYCFCVRHLCYGLLEWLIAKYTASNMKWYLMYSKVKRNNYGFGLICLRWFEIF